MYAQQVCLRLALSGQRPHRFTGHSQLIFDHAPERARTAPTPSRQRDAIGRGATVGVAGDRLSGSGLPGASAVTRPDRIGYLGKACDSQRNSARYSCNTLGAHMTVPRDRRGMLGRPPRGILRPGDAALRFVALPPPLSRPLVGGGSPLAAGVVHRFAHTGEIFWNGPKVQFP